jgi:iron complex transport system ATP-binding protein
VTLPARVSKTALLLAVSGVSVTYHPGGRDIIALCDASLSLSGGEVVGLVGPNGSGKTTLIRIVTGVVRPDSGHVTIAGRDAERMRQVELARQIAVVPQEPVLPPAFTALACVLMGRTPHLRLLQNEGASDLEAARRAMLATDTWLLADRLLGELSGGERQRVVVARALAQETPILLLDEPTAHLDLGHQASVLGLMRGFARNDGKAVLAVVHDLTLAARYCDRLVMLNNGSVVADGKPDEVLTPERLRQVYGVTVDVFPHPTTGRPVVAPGDEG